MPTKCASSKTNTRSSQDPQASLEARNLRRLHWGIFEVAFEPPNRCSSMGPTGFGARILQSAPFAARLLRELLMLAPLGFTTYALGCLWSMASSILSIYMASSALDLISMPLQHLDDGSLLVTLVYSCLASTFVSTLVERIKKDISFNLRGQLRAHFLPKLARVRMELATDECDASFPGQWQFEEVVPGWDIIESLCHKLGTILTVLLQTLVLVHLYLKKEALELKLLIFFCVYYPILLYVMPQNGIGGAEYTFWTNNFYYQRLAVLYTLIFSTKYQEDIRKDGISSSLATEYEKTSNSLIAHRPDAIALASNNVSRPLSWDLLSCIIIDLPVIAYILTLSWSTPSNVIARSLLLRFMTESIRRNTESCIRMNLSLDDICLQAERFYTPLMRIKPKPTSEVNNYPDPITSSAKGMKLIFRDVSLIRHDVYTGPKNILHNVSFTIQPGQIVAIVGPNSSGKSTLLKLLPRLMEASSGDILIDGNLITSFDVERLRSSMTVIFQSPQELYPVSLRENILFGLPNGKIGMELLDEAAKLGGAYSLLRRVGYDAFPSVIPVLGQSMGPSPRAAVDARNFALSARRLVQLSREETQRILASRAFFRLLCGESRLVVVDDALSELDPLSEMKILNNIISLRNGKTILYVAHRMNHIITQADLILYMKDGTIVEQGTHQELIKRGGHYATLHMANGSRS